MPEVSVLIPVYNVQKYVAEAIESILNQTYTDFELIVLDDCSTDNTSDIVKNFSDPRIIYHHNNKNLGLAENLNVGLKMARGIFIARMDGDDISLPTRLEVQIDFLEKNPDIDLCSCGMKLFGAEDKIWIRDRNPEQVKITMMFYSAILHASSIFRRESFEKHNLVYNPDAFPAEDYDLWSRAVFYCKMVNIPDILYKYRIHANQVTRSDYNSDIKSREIQICYLKRAFPGLSETEITNIIESFIQKKPQTISEINKSKEAYLAILNANKSRQFFHPVKLKTNLKRLFQNRLYEYIRFNKSIGFYQKLFLISQLRIKQVLKLIS